MPELPEVETTLRGIAPFVAGKPLVSWNIRNPFLRWPVELPEHLRSQVVGGLYRRGKYIVLSFAGGGLIVHLGMSGSLRLVDRHADFLTHDHVELDFGGAQVLRLNDPRRFGCIRWQDGAAEDHPLLASLGPEPLGNEFSGSYLHAKARSRKVAVKSFLMDAHVVVGVGNIYANEALFLAGIRPTRRAGKIPLERFDALAGAVRTVLANAIVQGGTTLRDFVNPEGRPGYFKQQLKVYDRSGQPCASCGAEVASIVLGGRGTFFCPRCQPARGFGPRSC